MNKEMDEYILKAALDVVNENTISGTRMHLIAKKADVAQSNIHYHYQNKRNLMLALHKMVVNHYIDIRNQLRASDAHKDYDASFEGQLEIYIMQKLETILNQPEYDIVELDFWLQAKTDPDFYDVMSEAFATWRGGIGDIIDRYKPDLSPEKRAYLPHMIISMLEGATLQYHIDQDNFDPVAYLELCKQTIMSVIGEA